MAIKERASLGSGLYNENPRQQVVVQSVISKHIMMLTAEERRQLMRKWQKVYNKIYLSCMRWDRQNARALQVKLNAIKQQLWLELSLIKENRDMKAPEQKQTKRELIPKGTHRAVCVSIVDLWSEKASYKGREKLVRKVRLTFELPDQLIEIDGVKKPKVIGKKYTFSMTEKAILYQDITSWFGEAPSRDFDLAECLGRPALLQVIHQKNKSDPSISYAWINTIIETKEKVEPQSELLLLDLGNFDQSVFIKLPEWMQDVILASPEYGDIDLDKLLE